MNSSGVMNKKWKNKKNFNMISEKSRSQGWQGQCSDGQWWKNRKKKCILAHIHSDLKKKYDAGAARTVRR